MCMSGKSAMSENACSACGVRGGGARGVRPLWVEQGVAAWLTTGLPAGVDGCGRLADPKEQGVTHLQHLGGEPRRASVALRFLDHARVVEASKVAAVEGEDGEQPVRHVACGGRGRG